MDKKPIKRSEHIVKLSRDHHASLLFCWKLRQGTRRFTEKDRIIKYLRYFLDHHFIPHFKEEEEFLFKPVQDEIVQKAIDDHQNIKALINELIDDEKSATHDQFATLADMVDAHVRYEERILFPHIEEVLTTEQLEIIGKKIPAEPLLDNYADDFWSKPASI